MPVAKSDISNFITPILRSDFYDAYFQALQGPAQAMLDLIASTVTIDGDTARFPFVGDIPQMTRWVDERQYDALGTNSYSVTLGDPWEETVAIKRTAINDDMTGQLRQRARDLGTAVVNNRLKQVISALLNGTATTAFGACYDGLSFFNDSHVVKTTAGAAGTADNNATGVYTAANMKTWIQTMQLFTSDQGNPLSVTPTHLLVGPASQWAARELLESPIQVTRVGEGSVSSSASAASDFTNVLDGQMRVITCPWITGAQGFLLDLSKGVKPIVLVEQANAVEFQSLEEASEHSFKMDEFLFGVRDRFEIGYGPWQLALYTSGA